MDTRTVQLRWPIVFAGQEHGELTVRRITIGDQEDAMQMAIRTKRQLNPLTVECAIYAYACKVPYDAIRALSDPDFKALRRAYNIVNGIEDEEEEADPTAGTRATGSES